MEESLNPPEKSSRFDFLGSAKTFFGKEFIFVSLVFLLALIVRWHLARYELIFEFDSYWHARMVSYILQGLPAPMVDPLGYYHNVAAATIANPPLLFWYISAALYKLFTLNAGYTIERLIWILKFLPAFFGALTSVGMYFLGKELFKGPHEKQAGFFAAIFASVVPSFVYRTMGGFFEDDSMGFLWMVFGFVFFVRATRAPALNRENLINAVLAGILFAFMALTWSAVGILIPILLGVCVLQYFSWLGGTEPTRAHDFLVLWIISFIILAIGATYQSGLFWLSQLGGLAWYAVFNIGADPDPIQVLLLMVGLIVILRVLYSLVSKGKIPAHYFNKLLGVIVLIAVLLPIVVVGLNLNIKGGDVLGNTIGEESTGNNYFGNKYSIMILFAVIGIPALGYFLIRKVEKNRHLILPLVWIIFTFYLAWVKLKFTFYWGLPLALMGGAVFVLALKWTSHRSITIQKIVMVGMGILLLGSIAAGTFFVSQNVPNIESTPEWKTALFWAEKNMPEDTKFLNWWDEGHWISLLSNRKVLIDNRNADTRTTGKVAEFILSTDSTQSWKIADSFGSTHLIFGDDLLGKLPNLGFFAYDIRSTTDPRIQSLFGTVISCSTSTAPVTKEKSYSCGSNKLTPEQLGAYPTGWQSTPNGLQNGVPLYIYRSEDNQKLFAFTEKANQTMLVKLWFDEPNATALFTPIYANSGVRIFQKNPLPIVTKPIIDSNSAVPVLDANAI